MADEITVVAALTVIKGHLQYQNQPQSFQADLETAKGPCVGALTIDPQGTVINLSQLQRPGMAVFRNLDTDNFCTLGVWDGTSFYPFAEILPGEHYVYRLSRYLNEEFLGTGTGTNADTNQLMGIADTAEVVLQCEVFDT